MNKAAFALGQFVGADRLTQSEVESALFDAAVANGYVAKDGPAAARATIRSGIEKGSLEPRLNGAEPRRTASSFTNGRASAPSGDGALPSWTAPNEKGLPRFEAIGEGEPPSLRDEIPGRRHLYRRNGEPVRMKVKRRGGGFFDFYRVRRPDTGQIGWQAKKPAGYEPAPYMPRLIHLTRRCPAIRSLCPKAKRTSTRWRRTAWRPFLSAARAIGPRDARNG